MAKYSGFTSYLTTGTFTPEFVHDYKYWCWKIYKRWTLYTDFDTFYSICWEALLKKIKEFNPKIATIQTFCISRINNEAMRIWTYNKTKVKQGRVEVDSDNPVIQGDLVARSETELFDMFHDFELYAATFGIKVNIPELYKLYTTYKPESKIKDKSKQAEQKEESAPLIAFAAWRAMRKDVGGRTDIEPKKKCKVGTE